MFELFDDFKGPNLDTNKWSEDAVNDITHTIDNHFRFESATSNPDVSCPYWIYDNSDTGSQHQAIWVPLSSFIVEWTDKISTSQGAQSGGGFIALVGSDDKVSSVAGHCDGNKVSFAHHLGYMVEGTVALTSVPNGDMKNWKMVKNGNIITIYADGIEKTNGISNDVAHLALVAGTNQNADFPDILDVKNLRVRKYASPEPTISIGTEQFISITNATLTSTPIPLPENMTWSTLSLTKTEPANTYINVSIIDDATNQTIPGYENLTARNIDISNITVDAIRLKAYFEGDGQHTPSLDSWGVEWTAENAWRDSFTGDSKVAYPYGVDEHIVGYWRFEEGCGDVAKDISGNGNDGVLQNMGEDNWVDGVRGKGLEFDGEDEYVSSSSAFDPGSNDHTIEFWVKAPLSTESKALVTGQTDFTFAIWANEDTGKIVVHYGNDGSSWNIANAVGNRIGDSVIADDNWHYIAMVRDENNVNWYVDSSLDITVPISGNGFRSTIIDIGRHAPSGGAYFNGTTDEVRISSVARTPDEIHQAYQAGISIHGGQVQLAKNEIVPDGNTSALWHFNEGDGIMLEDSSGNGNDGVIHGANWTDGVMGKALEFDGEDDYVKIPNDNAMSGTNNFTISLWAKVNSWINTFTFLDFINGNYHQLTFGAYINPGKLGVILPTDQWYEFNTLMDDTSWAMYTVTRSGSTLSLYKDGSFLESQVGNAIQIGNSNGYYQSIGRTDWGAGDINYYSGTIDEVAIYDRALTASEIYNHSNYYRPDGAFRSELITLPANKTWDTFHCNRTVPDNTYLNISIHDAETNVILWMEYSRICDPYINLSSIDPVDHPSIYLNATFQSNRTETPILRDWAVNWTAGVSESQPPQWYKVIDNISFDEDTSYDLNFSQYVRDVNDPPSVLAYDICHAGGAMEINGTINNSSITFETNLANWSGNATFYIVCLNEHGPSRSNNFTVFVTPVDDRPMWKHPISDILIEEDNRSTRINLIDLVEDAEDDPYNFSSSVNDSNIEVNISQGVMKIIPADNWYGEASVELLVYQASNSSLNSSAFFTVKVTSENDLPITTLISPSNGSMWTENEITLRWSCDDPDGPLQKIQYEVYLSTDLDVVLNRNKTGMSIPSMYATENANITLELPDGTYYWSVIGFDGIGYGSCAVGYYIFNINTNLTVPEVVLLEPLNDIIINKKYATLHWKLNTTTEREIVYRVYFGTDKDNLTEKTTTSNASFNVTGLEDGNTYYWKVIPHNGSIEGICKSGTWHFTVNTSFVPVYSITAELDSSRLDIVRGGSGMFNITLTNNGNVPVTVTLFPEGALAGSVDIRGSVIVPLGSSRKVPVWINDTSSIEAGLHQLVINISHNGKDMSLSLPVTITEQVSVIDEGEEPGLSGAAFALIIAGVVIVLILIIVFFILRKKRKKPEASPELEGEIEEEFEEGIGEDYEKDMKTLDEEETLKEFMAEPSDEEMEGVEDMVKEREEFESPIRGISPPTGMVEPGLPPAPAVAVPEPLHLSPPPEVPLPALPEAPPELEPVPSSMENLIPGYTLSHKIGSGGFAAVYRGMDSKGKPVAIKVPKHLDGTVDMRVLEEFRAESDIWKKLKHKNIVTFHKGDIRPVPYMVIEYMGGGNLLDVLKGEPMPIDEAISLIKQILSGMAYAHRMASVHRDVKPENILFTVDGTPKITDWGIGKFMASESMSKTAGIKGTLAYSAPEQVSKDEYGEVDWSTDVFQLGIVFYEMLTGENPFVADDLIGVVNNIVNKIPVPPSSLRPGIPPEIDTVILRALEKDKDKRFISADTMLAKLVEGIKDRERNITHYRRVLERALKDGIISPDEGEMLEEFRDRYDISTEEHGRILGEMGHRNG